MTFWRFTDHYGIFMEEVIEQTNGIDCPGCGTTFMPHPAPEENDAAYLGCHLHQLAPKLLAALEKLSSWAEGIIDNLETSSPLIGPKLRHEILLPARAAIKEAKK